MSVHPQRLKRIRAFMTIADREMRGARLLTGDLLGQGMFLAQQAVEKLLRAVIEPEGLVAGPTHNLRELARILGVEHPLYDDFIALDTLSPAATRYRYPSGAGRLADLPPEDEFEASLRSIAGLQDKVTRFLGERGFYSKGSEHA